MTTSPTGVEFVKLLEGFQPKAYPDFGENSIGWGHRSKLVADGMVIDKAQGEVYLAEDIGACESTIARAVKVPLTQNQYDALVSFVFNTGRVGPSMLKRLNASDYGGAAAEFGKWVYAGGKVHKGLTARRAKERRLFEMK